MVTKINFFFFKHIIYIPEPITKGGLICAGTTLALRTNVALPSGLTHISPSGRPLSASILQAIRKLDGDLGTRLLQTLTLVTRVYTLGTRVPTAISYMRSRGSLTGLTYLLQHLYPGISLIWLGCSEEQTLVVYETHTEG